MKKVGFITLGCKVNIYESNALKCELTDRGYTVGEADSDCDCFIINTCSVTNTADSKSRKMIHKCIKMNPSAILCVMGCYAQTNDEVKEIDGIDILIGNGNKKSVVDTIDSMISGKRKEKSLTEEMICWRKRDADRIQLWRRITKTEYPSPPDTGNLPVCGLLPDRNI